MTDRIDDYIAEGFSLPAEIVLKRDEMPEISDKEYAIQYALGSLPTRPINSEEHWIIAGRLDENKKS